MEKIPFSIYDFFGYLSSGFILLIAFDVVFVDGNILNQDVSLAFGIFLVVVAYIAGQITANISGYLIEEKFVRNILGEPPAILFSTDTKNNWKNIFPGFYRPLPKTTQDRVLLRAKTQASINEPGPALFYHCFSKVKNNEITLNRLNTFLNLYGFCRNISMSLFIAFVALLSNFIYRRIAGFSYNITFMWWGLAAGVAAVGMLYRYLKFFRQYSLEVFTTYAEAE
jgi:hypothetical protein